MVETPRHRDTTASAPVEKKAWIGAAGTFAASVALALLVALMGDPSGMGAMPGWAEFVLIAIGPTAAQFLSAYAAPHTPRTDPAALRAVERR